MNMSRLLGATLLAANLGAAPFADAQELRVLSRESILSGNFAVGFATFGDSGSDRQVFDTTALPFAHTIGDSGGVDGLFGDVPVSGTGSFSSSQLAEWDGTRWVIEGTAGTAVSTPYGYVSVGANALSQLELLIELPEPMYYTLDLVLSEAPGATVNGLTPRADALFRLSGPGEVWLFQEAGSFIQGGMLSAGQWRINAFADTRGNGAAGFQAGLLLTPVPEPAPWLMLSLGMASLLWRARRKEPARPQDAAHAID